MTPADDESCPPQDREPADVGECERTVRFFMLEKAFYEIAYELANRPDWLEVPLRGALTLIAGASLLFDSVRRVRLATAQSPDLLPSAGRPTKRN